MQSTNKLEEVCYCLGHLVKLLNLMLEGPRWTSMSYNVAFSISIHTNFLVTPI